VARRFLQIPLTVHCGPSIFEHLTFLEEPTGKTGRWIDSNWGRELTPNLIWIDLEMTGLDPEKEVILEIATIVTDSMLEVLAEGPVIAINYSEQVLATMEAWSKCQHESSGLVARVKTSMYDCRRAEEETLAFLTTYSEKKKSPLCGNTVWQDRRFLIKHMPRLEEFFHYRNIDVSSLKELVRRWYPSLPPYQKKETHLAINDIRESIQELRYYRENVFLPADFVSR
jgi:oligoribonuclease